MPPPLPLASDEAPASASSPEAATPDEPRAGEELTLRRALSLVLMRSPELAGAATEIRAREAERLQAGLPPNPEISTGVENFSGSGPYHGLNSTETTVELSQLIELGGERAIRIRRATASSRLAGWDYEALRLDVLTTATERFVDVLAAQRRVGLARRLLGVADRLQGAARSRVAAGKASPIDASRAEIVVAEAQTSLDRARTGLAAARRRLAVLWGAERAQFAAVAGSFPAAVDVAPADRLEKLLDENPVVARWADELDQRRASLALAEANAVPDITVGLGGRRFEDTGDSAVVAHLSIPLPLFDRNQGNVAAARERIDSVRYDREAARHQLRAAFIASYGDLSAASGQLRRLRSTILPKAQLVFDGVTEGYREGKFDLLSLLDAQRSLFEARLSEVDAEAAYLKAKTEVEGLIGRRLDSVERATP
jgi:outer membrane protein, heavy metal efflux system